MIRRRNRDGIDLAGHLGKHLAEITKALRIGMPFGRSSKIVRIDIAQRNDIHLGMGTERPKIRTSHPSNTDARQPKSIRGDRGRSQAACKMCSGDGTGRLRKKVSARRRMILHGKLQKHRKDRSGEGQSGTGQAGQARAVVHNSVTKPLGPVACSSPMLDKFVPSKFSENTQNRYPQVSGSLRCTPRALSIMLVHFFS